MASIRENVKNGKVISYRFTICLGRNNVGKQIRKYTTWTIPVGLTVAKARKAAERAADVWEQEITQEYQKECATKASGNPYHIPAEKRRDDFISFIHDTWFPLQVRDGKHKPKTIAFYDSVGQVAGI